MSNDRRGEEVEGFERWLAEAEPRLRRAYAGLRGPEDARDAVAEALGYAWEHWARVGAMDNSVGYAFRVGLSRTRTRLRPVVPARGSPGNVPDVEPKLLPALKSLPERQRTAVWLVHACGWSNAEAGEAMQVSPSTVSTHVGRALDALRRSLEVANDV